MFQWKKYDQPPDENQQEPGEPYPHHSLPTPRGEGGVTFHFQKQVIIKSVTFKKKTHPITPPVWSQKKPVSPSEKSSRLPPWGGGVGHTLNNGGAAKEKSRTETSLTLCIRIPPQKKCLPTPPICKTGILSGGVMSGTPCSPPDGNQMGPAPEGKQGRPEGAGRVGPAAGASSAGRGRRGRQRPGLPPAAALRGGTAAGRSPRR